MPAHSKCSLLGLSIHISIKSMNYYFTNWTNRNDNHSWIDQAFLPHDLIEQNPRKDLSNQILDTGLYGQVRKLKQHKSTNKQSTNTTKHVPLSLEDMIENKN
ncbi:unnamed protein product [Rotaria sp. Silwood2]|nr:unnamed protein product [Rotaria sp. Silwood2]